MEPNKKITIDKRIIDRTIDAQISVEDNRILIDYRARTEVQPLALLVFEGQSTIVWERELSSTEKGTGRIEEDFRDFVCSHWAMLDYSFRIALKYEKEGQKGIAIVTHLQKYNHTSDKKIGTDDKRRLTYKPLELRDVTMDNGIEYPRIIAMPFHMESDSQFAVRVSEPKNMMVKFLRCWARKIRYHGTNFLITVDMPKPENPISNVYLVSRRGNAIYSMHYTTKEEGHRLLIVANIDLMTLELVDPFWYICIETEMYGYKVWIQPSIPKKLEKNMKITPFHGKMKGDMIFFARPLKTRICQLVIRKCEDFDSFATRVKELLAMVVAGIFGSFYKGKGYWLVFEKFCAAAQDNGYAFFQFCMKELSKKENKHIYYIIDRKCSAYNEVKKYGRNVVDFMSFRHMLYSLIADMYVASESKAHLYAWRGKPSLVYSRIRNKNIFFLQHGVLALKRVEKIFGKTGSDAMTYIVTTSKHEQDIVINNHGYSAEYAPILGLARWDSLCDESTEENRTILVMPTWRKWIQDTGAEAFMESDYFQKYSGMLNNGKLIKALRDNDIRLLFYSHPKFKEYMDEFTIKLKLDTDRCEVISFGEKPLNELIKTSKMLITDYSSVCWDFLYLGKPIIFYQFDYDLYMESHGSYIDMTKELWGDRYQKEEELVNGILEYITNDFEEKPRFAEMRPNLFGYIDHNNSRRTYEYLKKKVKV